MDFHDIFSRYKSFDFADFFRNVGGENVRTVLAKERLTEKDFLTLLSPAAEAFLETMAGKAHRITVQNFGKVIFLFTPLYLSDYCENQCAYCGFNVKNAFVRRKLTEGELEKEATAIAGTDMRHVLILSGESREHASPDYIKGCLKVLRKHFSSISLEIYPLNVEEYRDLIKAGADGLTVYQEVYDERIYDEVHLSGPKKDYLNRLDAPERGCRAGMRTVTIGPLLGLNDWRREAFLAGIHAHYLQNKYWDVDISLSFPRFRPHMGNFQPRSPVDDRGFVQIIMASRLFMPRTGITVSTRENSAFRDNILPLGVTKMSAWSSTEVGGRTQEKQGTGQFSISDCRNTKEMKEMLLHRGYQPIFKDWHRV